MTVTLDSPATRADVLALLTRGARAGSVLRLMASDMAQLAGGFSYTLRDNGVVLGAAGFFPAAEPAPEIRAIAAGRPVYALWLIAGEGLARHMPRVLHLARGYIARLDAAGSIVVAEVDHGHASAERLARLVGLVPRAVVAGHDLWANRAQ